jgi:hypothetical protein
MNMSKDAIRVGKSTFRPLRIRLDGLDYQIVAPVSSYKELVEYIQENRGATRKEGLILNWMNSSGIRCKFVDVKSEFAGKRCFAIYVDDKYAVRRRMERMFRHELR